MEGQLVLELMVGDVEDFPTFNTAVMVTVLLDLGGTIEGTQIIELVVEVAVYQGINTPHTLIHRRECIRRQDAASIQISNGILTLRMAQGLVRLLRLGAVDIVVMMRTTHLRRRRRITNPAVVVDTETITLHRHLHLLPIIIIPNTEVDRRLLRLGTIRGRLTIIIETEGRIGGMGLSSDIEATDTTITHPRPLAATTAAVVTTTATAPAAYRVMAVVDRRLTLSEVALTANRVHHHLQCHRVVKLLLLMVLRDTIKNPIRMIPGRI